MITTALRPISFVKEVWNRQLQIFGVLYQGNSLSNPPCLRITSFTSCINGISGAAIIGIYADGAKLVVTGEMTVGSLIGT